MSTSDTDWSAWYTADQEAARAAYAAVDAGALVGLVAVLAELGDGHMARVKTFQAELDLEPEKMAGLEESRAEMLAAFAGREDFAEHANAVSELGQRMREMLDKSRESMSDNLASVIAFHTHLAFAAAGRRHLVQRELEQRGLTPRAPDTVPSSD